MYVVGLPLRHVVSRLYNINLFDLREIAQRLSNQYLTQALAPTPSRQPIAGRLDLRISDRMYSFDMPVLERVLCLIHLSVWSVRRNGLVEHHSASIIGLNQMGHVTRTQFDCGPTRMYSWWQRSTNTQPLQSWSCETASKFQAFQFEHFHRWKWFRP